MHTAYNKLERTQQMLRVSEEVVVCAASRTACCSKNSCKGPRSNRKLQ